MTTTTLPQAPVGWEPVRSCLVTREQLREWGFAVRDCPTGHGTVTTGPSLAQARTAAWRAGWTRVSSFREEERTWWKG